MERAGIGQKVKYCNVQTTGFCSYKFTPFNISTTRGSKYRSGRHKQLLLLTTVYVTKNPAAVFPSLKCASGR